MTTANAPRWRTVALALVAAVLFSVPGAKGQCLYVTVTGSTTGNDFVAQYNAMTGAVVSSPYIGGLTQPENITVAGNNLYTTSGSSVVEYNIFSNSGGSFATGFSSPFGLAVTGNTLFVSDFANSRIGSYNATTGAVSNASFITGVSSVRSLALSGNSLFATTSSGIAQYNATTGATINASFATGLNGPFGLATAGNNLFVANVNGNTVVKYDVTTGAAVSAFTSPAGLVGPSGLLVLGNVLYVVNRGSGLSGGFIGEYDATTGTALNASFVTGLRGPGFIAYGMPTAIPSVPEPATWAALLCGLGLLGFTARRTRRWCGA